jgi:radical SAM protein with 4Fe4S-binding SPASM domain
MPTVALYVCWDGRAYPCANPEAHQGDALGDLTTQDFAEVWNGRAFRNLRAGLASGDAPDVCRRCPILHRAAGPLEGARSDMVSRYGTRDLAPVGANGHDLVEQAVESGLAAHAHERWFELLGYSHRLEEEVHGQGSDNERLGHERDAARLELEAVTHHRNAARLEVEDLIRQRDALERERRALGQHAVTLEAEREHFVRHIANLERILARTRAQAVHRVLSDVKDFVLRPKLRPPLRYVPPWVADGSRRAGEPPARLD